MESEQQGKDELERLMREVGRKGGEIARWGGEFLQWGQYVADLSEASYKVVQGYPLPRNVDLGRVIGSWQDLNEHEDAILGSVRRVSIQPVASSGSNVAYEMTGFAKPDSLIRDVAVEKRGEARADAERLVQVIYRFADKESVLSLLHEFGLDSAVPGRKSPAELFEIAWAAFEKPVRESSPAGTSLIPMRECINGVIAELLRRRRKQEPAPNEYKKIESICGQLARDDVSKEDIQRLAGWWGELVNELSNAKEKDYTREEWWASLQRATLFLKELLQSLDPTKMRSKGFAKSTGHN